MRYRFLMLSAAFTSLLFVACGEGTSSTSRIRPPESAQEVYANMLDAIGEPGKVLHTKMTYRTDSPISPDSYSFEVWLDAAAGRARRVFELNGQQAITVIEGNGSYSVDEHGSSSAVEALTCHESDSPVLSTLLGCHGYTEESQTWVGTTSSYRGEAAVTIVTEGRSSGSDESFTFTDHLHIDANSWLPIALDRERTLDTGKLYDVETNVKYEHEFVDATSLDDDFFDPASIGYVERDPVDDLGRAFEIEVYWLGPEFDPQDDSLPALALRDAAPYHAPGGLRMYRASLAYRPVDDEFGPPIVGLQEWRLDDWEAFLAQSRGGNWWDAPDTTRTEHELSDRRVVVHERRAESWDGDRFIAWVYLDDTFVMITDFDAPTPYNSERGILAIAEGLTPY